MPDDDRFRYGLSRRWLQVRRSIADRELCDRTADLVAKAAADDLRKLGGLRAVHSAVPSADLRAEGPAWPDTILNEPTVSGRHILTLFAAVQITEQLALTSPAAAARAFAEKLISNIADDRLDRMLPGLLSAGTLTAAQFADLRDEIHRHPQLTKLRDQLVKHPDAIGLRAPRRTIRPSGLKDLLNTDIGSL